MRKALVVGINHYPYVGDLHGCVNDAHEVKNLLATNSDGSVNFDTVLMTASSAKEAIDRDRLRELVQKLFEGDNDIALLYFAGHGHIEATGGYLCASDCRKGHDGLSLGDVLTFANQSKSRNKVILLDSCHSGIAGSNTIAPQYAELSDGLTILSASTAEQYANEQNGSGIFTNLLVDALTGAAGNLVGEVTPGSVYAHIDQSLGPWQQRPVFKTNVKNFVSLRRVQPPIALGDLQRLVEFFPTPGAEVQLDPSFEPEITGRPQGAPPPNPDNTAKFAVLQKYNRVNLVVPVGASKPNMWHAAIESKSCKLTVLGEHYRRLVEAKRI
jgi:Caspase domain